MGDSDRSEKVVVGDSVPDRCEDDFQPKKAPSPPAGDFGRGSRGREESDVSDSADSVRCTPSSCRVMLGVGWCIELLFWLLTGEGAYSLKSTLETDWCGA